MVGIGLMCFPTCPQEALLLQEVFYFSWFLSTFVMWLIISNVLNHWLLTFYLILNFYMLPNYFCLKGEESTITFLFFWLNGHYVEIFFFYFAAYDYAYNWIEPMALPSFPLLWEAQCYLTRRPLAS